MTVHTEQRWSAETEQGLIVAIHKAETAAESTPGEVFDPSRVGARAGLAYLADGGLLLPESPQTHIVSEAESQGGARLVIHMNSNANMSRGKYAAHAVHAALVAFGVHHGGAVVVLGAKPGAIEKLPVVIRDAGLTELEPGTLTAGTDWAGDRVAGRLLPEGGETRTEWRVRYVGLDNRTHHTPMRDEADADQAVAALARRGAHGHKERRTVATREGPWEPRP